MITPAQCRAARAWLNLSQDDLGELVSCHRTTIARFESGEFRVERILVLAVQHVLEERGIRFHFGFRDGIDGPDAPQTEPSGSK